VREWASLGLLVAVGCGGGDDGPPTEVEPDPCETARVAYPEQVTLTGDTRHVHDPEIVRDGDAYYVLSTNDGIPLRRSADLLSWSFETRVFPNQLPSWATQEVPGVEAPWAPGVGYFDGAYHLYYSLSTFGSPRSVIGLATSPTLDPGAPDYGWDDQGKVLESFAGYDYNAIDAAVMEDAAGGLWLAWGSWGGGIKMRALDRSTGFLSPEDDSLYSLARRPVEQALEGPYIVRRGDYYYLFVSFDLCCQGVQSTYTVRVGRSASVTGPYTDRNGRSMMEGGGSLVLDAYGRVRGPGHASVLEVDGGYLLVHHFYDDRDLGIAHLQIRPLLWDDAGWPLAGEPYDGTPPGPPPPEPGLAGSWGYWVGEEQAREVELRPGGTALACGGSGSWAYEAPMLTVEWDSIGVTGGPRVDRSILAADGESLVGRTAEGGIVRGYRLTTSD
jgi:arabinan endo-1,5-alpha-L-arabinosidase